MKFRLALAAALVATSAFAEEPAPTPGPSPSPAPAATPAAQKFYLELDQADLDALSRALVELPKRVADPLILKLNAQLTAQQQIKDAADKALDDGVAKARKRK